MYDKNKGVFRKNANMWLADPRSKKECPFLEGSDDS